MRQIISVFFLIISIGVKGQIDTVSYISKYQKCIDFSYDILLLLQKNKASDLRNKLPDNVLNHSYLNSKKYFKQEVNWASSLLKKNGLSKKDEIIIYKKKMEVSSLNIIDEDIIVSFIIPFSERNEVRNNKIEIIFKNRNVGEFETINFVRKDIKPIPPP